PPLLRAGSRPVAVSAGSRDTACDGAAPRATEAPVGGVGPVGVRAGGDPVVALGRGVAVLGRGVVAPGRGVVAPGVLICAFHPVGGAGGAVTMPASSAFGSVAATASSSLASVAIDAKS